MKKPLIIVSVLLSLSLILSACGRRTNEPSSVTSSYESTTGYENSSSSEAAQQVSANPETSAVMSTTQTQASTQTETTSQTFTVSDTTAAVTTTASSFADTTVSTPTGTFEVSEMRAERDGQSIYGKIYIPSVQVEKLPAVILSHSANMTSDSMKSYCERIAKMGFVAYAFDFCGGSTNSRSDGKEADMTVFTEVEDLKAVLKMISELDFVDSQNIFLFGTSQGGLVSSLTAAEYPSAIKGLILFYPAFNIPETVQKYSKMMPQSLQSAYISTLLNYDVYEHITPYKGDVLIVHGTTDFVVPYSYSEKAAQIYENCELHLIKGATHGFNADNYVSFGNFDEETWSYAEAFLAEHCNNNKE